MSKSPNKSKITKKIFQYTGSSGTNIDLSSLYMQSDLEISRIEYEETAYHLYCTCKLNYGTCPYCCHSSHRVHSRYTRTIVDLSILGHPVTMTLGVRKFFCDNPHCRKKTFAEQPGDEIFRYRRRTRRCEMVVTQHGLSQSSESAQKLLKSIGITISGDTVLRDLHRMKIPENKDVSNIGIDDWAYRKGVTYGSIIVNLDTGKVIDLLNDRGVDSFQKWLDNHVQVGIVSRDRSTDYSSAITATGRNIVEVADRFHLNKNMSDCITKVIGSHYEEYRRLARPDEVQIMECSIEKEDSQQPDNPIKVKNDSRQIMFNEVKELQKKELKINRIAKVLGIARQTVRKYMLLDSLPKRVSKERNEYYLYDDYVESEHKKGKALSTIYKEIQMMGFRGSRSPFNYHYRYLSDGRRGYKSKQKMEEMQKRAAKVIALKREPLVPIRQIAHIVEKSLRARKLDTKEEHLIDQLMTLNWFREIYIAAGSFYKTIMGTDVNNLLTWLDTYRNSCIKELKTLAYGISLDIKAVQNAVLFDISNGIVEGFVNKLKVVKRMMYGKASLNLLRKKMVFSELGFN